MCGCPEYYGLPQSINTIWISVKQLGIDYFSPAWANSKLGLLFRLNHYLFGINSTTVPKGHRPKETHLYWQVFIIMVVTSFLFCRHSPKKLTDCWMKRVLTCGVLFKDWYHRIRIHKWSLPYISFSTTEYTRSVVFPIAALPNNTSYDNWLPSTQNHIHRFHIVKICDRFNTINTAWIDIT